MEFFTNDVISFLNNLDNHIPSLLNASSLRMIEANVIHDINALFLHNNEFAILNRIAQMIVKTMFNITKLNIHTAHINAKTPDLEYILSDYHMEFELNEKSLAFIQNIIKNTNIFNRSFVFIIKNADVNTNRNLFLELRRILDINHTSKFIITTVSTSYIEKSLASRGIFLNCCFPFEKVINSNIECIQNYKNMHQQMKEYYIHSKYNIINLIQNISFLENKNILLWQQHIDNTIEKIQKEKNQLSIINYVRDLVYKLFHVGIPLRDVAHYLITNFCNYTQKKENVKEKNKTNISIHTFTASLASIEHDFSINGKNILYYEKMFLELITLI